MNDNRAVLLLLRKIIHRALLRAGALTLSTSQGGRGHHTPDRGAQRRREAGDLTALPQLPLLQDRPSTCALSHHTARTISPVRAWKSGEVTRPCSRRRARMKRGRRKAQRHCTEEGRREVPRPGAPGTHGIPWPNRRSDRTGTPGPATPASTALSSLHLLTSMPCTARSAPTPSR